MTDHNEQMAPSRDADRPDSDPAEPRGPIDPGAHGGKPCGREAERPLSIPLAGWSDVLWRTRAELRSDNVVVVSAGVAFFGLLALVPTVGALVAIYGLLADPQDVARHLEAFSAVIPAAGGDLVRAVLERVVANSTGSLSARAVAGVAVAIWSASRGMRALMRALTIAYDEDPTRGWVRERALSYAYTAGALLVSTLAIAIIVVVPAIPSFFGVEAAAGKAVAWLRWPVLFLISLASLSALYRHGAARRPPKWRWTIVGAVVATVLWVAGSGVLSLYVRHVAHLDASYGSMGAFLVLMLWCFVTAFAILLGAELNAELEHQTRIDTTVGEPLPAGERGAFVADGLGPCRPRIGEVVRARLSRTKMAAMERVRRGRSTGD